MPKTALRNWGVDCQSGPSNWNGKANFRSAHHDRCTKFSHVLICKEQAVGEFLKCVHVRRNADQHEVRFACHIVALLNLRFVLHHLLERLQLIEPFSLQFDADDKGHVLSDRGRIEYGDLALDYSFRLQPPQAALH